ncbi:hypothetical protein [Solibacillus sp. CAU 1738]|uniref:hypothetical protein n=1 Tax=Solibacillus sp. CAU 1738 TaxID=3140363 RepID=UPI003260A7D0
MSNKEKTGKAKEQLVTAQYICGSTRDCCSNNHLCSRKVAYDSKGNIILNVCSLCYES